MLVMDIGGGSTELITGRRRRAAERAISLDIGSVRMTERFLQIRIPSLLMILSGPRTLCR